MGWRSVGAGTRLFGDLAEVRSVGPNGEGLVLEHERLPNRSPSKDVIRPHIPLFRS